MAGLIRIAEQGMHVDEQGVEVRLSSEARLPLPSLEDTLARYLRAATPVVTSPTQLQATRALVDEAVQERGLKLSRVPVPNGGCHTLLTAFVSSGSRRRCS